MMASGGRGSILKTLEIEISDNQLVLAKVAIGQYAIILG